MQSKQLTIAQLTAAIAFAFAGVAGNASAKDADPWYAGVDLGAGRVNIDCSGTTSCDKTGTTSRLTIGKRLNETFSLEGSYVDFRGVKASVNQPPFGAINGKFKSTGIEVAGLAHTPEMNGLSGYAKLGVASMKTTGTVSVPGLGSDSVSERKTTPVVGVGVNYALSPQLGLTAGYDWRRLSLDGEKEAAHSFTVGARYRF
ncbi:MAG TPA: outer membrane beta-barrel protein [Burkholderiaceae bacterium]|nr:outer membrane beta-barrel protein [Burkholderiaceae bacterium]